MKTIAYAILIIITFFSCQQLATSVINDFRLYKQESSCAMEFVNKGVERSAVSTRNGTCFIKNR